VIEMNIEELEEALGEVLPEGFQITFDARRQVVIKTGLVEDESGELHADGGADIDSDEDSDFSIPGFPEEDDDEEELFTDEDEE
jgi:hypothetical protein